MTGSRPAFTPWTGITARASRRAAGLMSGNGRNSASLGATLGGCSKSNRPRCLVRLRREGMVACSPSSRAGRRWRRQFTRRQPAASLVEPTALATAGPAAQTTPTAYAPPFLLLALRFLSRQQFPQARGTNRPLRQLQATLGRHWGDNMPDDFRHSVDTQASRKIGDSTIGEDLRITGNVSSKGEIHLDGEVHGDVSCVALVLGESATLEGNVTAEDVVIRGRLVGSVRGLRVTLQSMSHVEGDIYHQSLALEQGAYFRGQIAPLRRSHGARQRCFRQRLSHGVRARRARRARQPSQG